MAKRSRLRDDRDMTKLTPLLNLGEAVLQLATLFAVCVWGFEQNAFAGVAAPAVVGLFWHRWITSRLPTSAVRH